MDKEDIFRRHPKNHHSEEAFNSIKFTFKLIFNCARIYYLL